MKNYQDTIFNNLTASNKQSLAKMKFCVCVTQRKGVSCIVHKTQNYSECVDNCHCPYKG